MSNPAVRAVRVPVAGTAGVNQGRPLQVGLSEFSDATTGVWDTYQVGGSLSDGTADESWADSNYLETNNGNQAQMASAAEAYKANTIEFAGLDLDAEVGAPVQSLAIRTADVVMYAHAAYPSPGVPGAAFVRYRIYFDGRLVKVLDGVPALYDGVSAQTEVARFSLLSLIEDGVLRQRPNVLVSEAQNALDGLKVVVMPVTNGQSFVTDWYCGRVELEVSIFRDGDEEHYQRWLAVQICTVDPADPGFVDPDDVEYDSSAQRGGDTLEVERQEIWHTIPADAMADVGSLERWIRYHVWDRDGNPSSRTRDPAGWTEGSRFTILPEPIADWIRRTAEARILVELESVIQLDAVLWELAPGETKIYRCVVDRSVFPVSSWFISGFEVDGVAVEVEEELDRNQIVTGKWHFDEWGNYTGDGTPDTEHGAGYLYIGLPTWRHPGANATGALTMLVTLPMCMGPGVLAGPGNRVPYLPIVSKVPETEDAIGDFDKGLRYVPSGNLELDNVVLGRDEQPVLYRMFQTKVAASPTDRSFGIQNRNFKVKLFVPGSRWEDDAIEVLSGTVKWPSGNFLTVEKVQLDAAGIEYEGLVLKFAATEITEASWPNAHSSALGKKVQDVFGANHLGLTAHLVDVGDNATSRKAKAIAGGNVAGVDEVYLNGVVATLGWTYDAVNHVIEFTSTSSPDLATIEAAAITFDGDGVELDDYDGVPSATLQAGTLLKHFLRLMKREPVDAAFDALDDPDVEGSEDYAVRCVFTEETPIMEGIRAMEATRNVYVRSRFDGAVDVVRRNSTSLDAYSLILDESDLLNEPEYEIDDSEVTRSVTIEYNGYPLQGNAAATIAEGDLAAVDKAGTAASLTVHTYHATIEGARARLADYRKDEPYIATQIEVDRLATFMPAGTVIVLRNMKRAVDGTGETTWETWQARSVVKQIEEGKATIRIRKTGMLDWRERPY